jgi:hypothetical protein
MVGFAKVIPLLLFAAIVLQQKNIAKGNKGDARKDDGADFHADSPFFVVIFGSIKNPFVGPRTNKPVHSWDQIVRTSKRIYQRPSPGEAAGPTHGGYDFILGLIARHSM